jgi:hypothetical protein
MENQLYLKTIKRLKRAGVNIEQQSEVVEFLADEIERYRNKITSLETRIKYPVLYKCNGERCDVCKKDYCEFTSDIRYAKNFVMDGNIFFETPPYSIKKQGHEETGG